MFVIPVVNPEVAGPLHKELDKLGEKEFLKKELAELAVENPVLGFMVRKFAKASNDPKTTALCGLMVFKLLKSQAEANRMELEINLG